MVSHSIENMLTKVMLFIYLYFTHFIQNSYSINVPSMCLILHGGSLPLPSIETHVCFFRKDNFGIPIFLFLTDSNIRVMGCRWICLDHVSDITRSEARKEYSMHYFKQLIIITDNS